MLHPGGGRGCQSHEGHLGVPAPCSLYDYCLCCDAHCLTELCVTSEYTAWLSGISVQCMVCGVSAPGSAVHVTGGQEEERGWGGAGGREGWGWAGARGHCWALSSVHSTWGWVLCDLVTMHTNQRRFAARLDKHGLSGDRHQPEA